MSDKKYILTIDEGTSSTRAIIFDHYGREVAVDQQEFKQYFPKPGWVEHDANEIWNAVLSTIANTFIKSGIKPSQIASIGITNQRETTVIWDKNTGLPIYHAVVWQSRQSEKIAQKLINDSLQEKIHQKTGLLVDPYFSATKIRWILDQVPGAQERAEKGELLFGTIDTWLIWKLTDGHNHITDYTNASRTMLFNIKDLTWDKDILKWLNIPCALLPKVTESTANFGYTQDFTFYGSRVPISGVAGDQQAALFGQLAVEKGQVKNTYGTGAFTLMNIGPDLKLSQNKLLTSIAYGMNGQVNYALEGSIFVAGSAIQWLRDMMNLIDHASQSEEFAHKSSDHNEVYVVPAFTGLGAPYWQPNARGSVFGLTRGTSKYDFTKATLQSLAYQTNDLIQTMKKDTNIDIPSLKVDGGASLNNYLMQFQSDISNIPVIRSKNIETTALGAAFLAGLSVKYWKDIDELKSLIEEGQVFEPLMNSAERSKLVNGWKRAVKATIAFEG